MSKSLNSPTARLLQSSRLFSLPRPLAPPALETVSSTGVYRASETATLPYPTHQAIATPASSQFRGDFGLKRPLPAKAIKGRPHIRIRAQDNSAHITDFESALNHTQTQAKWQQIGAPLTVKNKSDRYTGGGKSIQSVYDAHVDNTDSEAVRLAMFQPEDVSSRSRRDALPSSHAPETKRWKYDGPWITGMQEGQFATWLSSSALQGRKEEFRAFLVQRMLERRVQDEERALREQGERRAISAAKEEDIRADIEANYDTEIKRLRDEHEIQYLGSEMTAAICDFLDLPGIRAQAESGSLARTVDLQNALTDSLASGQNGPPSTHPGAGLGHVRTNAVMENHPLWGPQAHGSPVLARVITPRSTFSGPNYQAKLGVGGVVTQDPVGDSFRNDRRNTGPAEYNEENIPEQYVDVDRMMSQIDPDLPGGNKAWVQPETAHIDEQGRIRLDVTRGDKEAVAVKRGKVEPIHESRSASTRGPESAYPSQSIANFGTGLPDMRRAGPPRSLTTGFDEELARRPLQESDAAAKIRELLGNAPRR
ncbi:hypothetical protein DOTSEDRAFT_71923 [Dothistroma septosporum NZE10]|uniref:Uncharacterized protein n=1 Tax=Dothistroma septosporum (strain NZE10 / CBS 128990) TaxID=675120 RepID=N1PLM2_DOTSN|nr:hypothetical protein DOTSEDRAFT_71923 [Dothistroma septosporum NZE10]